VQASIRGEPIPMVVDTGASLSSIDQGTAQKFNLELRRESRFRVFGAGGEAQVYNVTVPEFVIGNGRFAERVLMVFEGMRKDARRMREGLLGEDILGAFDLELHVQGGRLALYEKTACVRVPPWQADFMTVPLFPSLSGRIRFNVQIDGHGLIAELDSGATQTLLSWQGARKLGLTKESPGLERVGTMVGIDGTSRVHHRYRFQSFELAGERVRNPRLGISEILVQLYPQTYQGLRPSFLSEEPSDLFLGADWLRAHRVYVGRATEEMHFTYLSGSIFEK
jgi:predicted aspartyl protease